MVRLSRSAVVGSFFITGRMVELLFDGGNLLLNGRFILASERLNKHCERRVFQVNPSVKSEWELPEMLCAD